MGRFILVLMVGFGFSAFADGTASPEPEQPSVGGGVEPMGTQVDESGKSDKGDMSHVGGTPIGTQSHQQSGTTEGKDQDRVPMDPLDRTAATLKKPPFNLKVSNQCDNADNWSDCFEQANFCRLGRDTLKRYFNGHNIIVQPGYSPVGTVFIFPSLRHETASGKSVEDGGNILLKIGNSKYQVGRSGVLRSGIPLKPKFNVMLVPPKYCDKLKSSSK